MAAGRFEGARELMKLHFDEPTLSRYAAVTLSGLSRLCCRMEPLFDPNLPLPRLAPPAADIPKMARLLGIIPDPYGTAMCHAYAQMIGFASQVWPGMGTMLDAQPAFEWTMHNDVFNRRYRDHIVHQVRVAALGDLLLDQPVRGQSLLLRAVAAIRPRLRGVARQPEEFVRLAWWVAALFHDAMYAYENQEKHCRNLQTVCLLPLANPTAASWFKAQKALVGLVGSLTHEDIVQCERAKHSFAGAAELAMQHHAYEEAVCGAEATSIRDRRRTLFGLASEAILSHQKCRVAGEPIRFEAHPLAYLLVLSDELHETDRARAETTLGGPGSSAAVTRYLPGEINAVTVRTGIGGRTGKLRIDYHCRLAGSRIGGQRASDWRDGKQHALEELLELRRGVFDGLDVRVA